jgi:hypothetical protein
MKKLLFTFAMLAGMVAGVMVLSSFTKQNTKNVVEYINNDDGEYIDTYTAHGLMCSDDVPSRIKVDLYRRGPYNFYVIIQGDERGAKRDVRKINDSSTFNACVSWGDCTYCFNIWWK